MYDYHAGCFEDGYMLGYISEHMICFTEMRFLEEARREFLNIGSRYGFTEEVIKARTKIGRSSTDQENMFFQPRSIFRDHIEQSNQRLRAGR